MQQEEFKMEQPLQTDFANIAGSRVVLEQKKSSFIKKIIPPIIMLSAFAGILLLGWLAYKDSLQTTNNPDEVMTINADSEPVKVEPSQDEASGNVPNLDKKVYDAISVTESEKNNQAVEARPEEKIEEPIDRAQLAREEEKKVEAFERAGIEEVKPDTQIVEEKKPEELVKKEVLEAEKAAEKVEVKKEETKIAKKPAVKKKTAATKAMQVQLGSFKTEAEAKSVWQKVVKTNPTFFSDKTAKIERADLGAKGIFFRLRTGSFKTAEKAKEFCKQVKSKSKGQGCIVVSK